MMKMPCLLCSPSLKNDARLRLPIQYPIMIHGLIKCTTGHAQSQPAINVQNAVNRTILRTPISKVIAALLASVANGSETNSVGVVEAAVTGSGSCGTGPIVKTPH